MAINNKIAGHWKITEMSQWGQDFVDLVVPGYFKFDCSGNGSFQFGCVEGDISYEVNGKINFSWSGNDEYDPASGRGWFKLKNTNEIHGKIYMQNADNSTFIAMRQ